MKKDLEGIEPYSIPSASKIRRRILEMAFIGQSVHIPSAFSIVELVRTLHLQFLNYPDNSPRHKDRDFFVLSKGHGVMALYPILESRGWVPSSDITSYFGTASNLPGLYEASVPGCEANSGSLGQGVTVAVGLAKSALLQNTAQRVFCLVGDGELNEGSAWEAIMYAGHHKLKNFAIIIDLNEHQAMGATEDIVTMKNLVGLLTNFGFSAVSIDGHNEVQIERVIRNHLDGPEHIPLAVIARTVKGKGVSFMENNNSWHYKRLNPENYSAALLEVDSTP